MIMSSSTASFFTLWNNDNVLDTMLASDYKDPPRIFIKDESMENEIKDNTTLSIDMGGGKSSVSISTEQSPTLCTTHAGAPAVATFAQSGFGNYQKSDNASSIVGEHDNRITSSNSALIAQPKIRRITPIEAERLMGFPDNWTQIPWRGKPAEECPDSHRYKACGNSMCVNVMRWIGMRIEYVERKIK